MYSFALQRPATLADATANLGASVRPLAGGQTLIASLRMRLANPDALVDLSRIPDLDLIRKDGNSIVIGSMARHADVASSADVMGAIPALAQLAASIGDRQVRAMGTLGGSIANNDPAADYPAGVLGLNATVHTTQRKITADQYFQGLFSTALNESELITAVSFPIPKRAAYVKFKQPASRFALTGVFVAQTDGGVRVAVTGGGKGVFRHAGLEAALNQSFTAASAAAVKIDSGDLSTDLHGSAAYRANLISVLTQRAVTQAVG